MKREDSFQAWAANLKPEGRQMTHYDLLGLPLFESDTKLIREMVQKQLRAVWNYTNGPNAHQARKLRNKIDQSARCLLNSRLKSEYDRRLREQLGSDDESEAEVQPVIVETSVPQTIDVVAQRTMKAERESNQALIIGCIALFVAIALGIVFVFLPDSETPAPPRSSDVQEPAQKPLPKSTQPAAKDSSKPAPSKSATSKSAK